MSDAFKKLLDPDVLEAAATVTGLVPLPEAAALAAGLRLAEAWIRAGKTAEEIDAIVKRASAEAQDLANDWK